MSEQEIKQFIRSRIDEGLGPKAIAEELDDLYGLSPEEAHDLYLDVRGIETKTNAAGGLSTTVYQDEYAHKTYQLLLLNKTKEQIAEHFKIDMFTLNTWRDEIPEFGEAWDKALDADIAVAESLLKLCLGYEVDDVKIGFHMGDPVYAEFTKKHEPNLRAIEKWLQTRHPGSWKDVQHVETKLTSVVESLSDEELEQKMMQYGIIEAPSQLAELEVVDDSNS